MAIEFIGADTTDPGPRGAIARFVEATAAKDADAARAMLTESSREGFDIDATAIGEAVVRIGEVEDREGQCVVPTSVEDEDGVNEMPFVVREEDGELRVDFDASIALLMGGSPAELMEAMAESMGTAMKSVMEGVGDALAEGFSAMGAEMAEAIETATPDGPPPEEEEPEPCEAAEWHLPATSTEEFRDKIVETACSLGCMFGPAFMPFPDLLDTEEWAPEGSTVTTTRYGDEKAGFKSVDTVMAMEGYESRIVDVTAYGMPEEWSLRLVYSRTVAGDEPPMQTAHVQATAPGKTIRGIGGHLGFHFGWKDPAAGDDEW